MRIVWLLVKVVIFLVFLSFVVKNMEVVSVRYFLGMEWSAPLAFVILAVFTLGIVTGFMANMAFVVRQRREIAGLKRDLRGRPQSAEAPLVSTADTL